MTPRQQQTVWVGVASIAPLDGSEHQRKGLTGGYGFVAVRALTIEEAVRLLMSELAEGGSDLIGFEWISRLQDYDQDLNQRTADLIKKLDDYPVQFKDFHWHKEESKSN